MSSEHANGSISKKRILYIFPHPDDESFGPAPVMRRQVDDGHEVFLLTLTRGGATKVRHRLGYSVAQMGEVRYKEMLNVANVLRLTGMTVLDLPDGGLQELDPRELESIVTEHLNSIRPEVIVTYPVHGVSGFHDHLVTHAVVKRAFVELKSSEAGFLKRLAFITMPNRTTEPFQQGFFAMKQSAPELIDCEIRLNEKDKDVLKEALRCYETYQQIIEKSAVLQMIGDTIYFEIYQESFHPVLADLTERLE